MTETTRNPAWLERFEPIGYNCEAGFVFRHLGDQRSGLFRWAFIKPERLLDLLQKDFAGFYDVRNIVPHADSMVRDTAFDCAFHSPLKRDADGKFELDDNKVNALLRIEKAKIDREVREFRNRLHRGETICVLKPDAQISDELAQSILEAIDAIAGNHANKLLIVSSGAATPAESAHLQQVAPRLLRGQLTRVAPFNAAFDAAYDEWEALLRAAAATP